MQTFLPHADFDRSAEVLDLRRLGKQRVEVIQIVRAPHAADIRVEEPSSGAHVGGV